MFYIHFFTLLPLLSAAAQRTTINNALELLSAGTGGCIQFVERTTETNYVEIDQGGG